MMPAPSAKPLAGIRVLDLTQALAGPFATQLMVDLGADVVKVEGPSNQDNTREVPPFTEGVSHYFVSINHGKRSLGLDLKTPEGREVLLRLADKADVMISNYRAGTLEALGLAPALLAERNPRLVQCLISGFGQADSPYRRKPIYDANVQALAGFMSVTGEIGGSPLRCGISIGDMIPALFASHAISTALFQRERTGRGQILDVPMFDCMFSLLTYYITLTQVTGVPPLPSGSMHASVAPMGRFAAKDGWMMIAAFTEVFWRKLCQAVDRPEMAVDPRFADMKSRLANRDALLAELHAIFQTRTRAEWAEILDRSDVPNTPILDVLEVLNHPIMTERNLLRPEALPEGGTIQVARHPVVYGLDLPRSEPVAPAPAYGEHSDDVMLEWLEEDVAFVSALRRAGVLT